MKKKTDEEIAMEEQIRKEMEDKSPEELMEEAETVEEQRATAQATVKNNQEQIQVDKYQKVVELLKDTDAHFIKRTGKLMIKSASENCGWMEQSIPSFKMSGGLAGDKQADKLLTRAFRQDRRIREQVVTSFRFASDDKSVFNLVNADNWLKPTGGDVPEIFDVILDSLSDGKPEIRANIERWVAYKYLYPHDYKLMALILYGEGGAGKNEFVSMVLATLFCGSNVKVLSAEMAFGTYTGQMLGNVITLIDEFDEGRAFARKIKAVVGQQTVNINVKNSIQGVFENTSAYIVAGNNEKPSAVVEGSGVDRRWELIKLSRNVIHHAMNHLGYNSDHLIGKLLPDMQQDAQYREAEKWYADNLKYLTDPASVAAWFSEVVVKHVAVGSDGGYFMSRPKPLHGDDYHDAVNKSKPLIERFVRTLFEAEEFNAVRTMEMYKLFKLYVIEFGSSQDAKWDFNQKDFMLEVKKNITRYNLPVVHYQKADNKQSKANGGGWTSFTGWVSKSAENPLTYQRDRFFVEEHGKVKIQDAWEQILSGDPDGMDELPGKDGNVLDFDRFPKADI